MPLFHTKISKLCRFSNVKTVFFTVFPISFSRNQDSRRGMSRIGPPSFQLGVYRSPPLSRGSEFPTRRIEESASPRREYICPGCNPGPPTSSPDKNTQPAHPGCLTRHKQMPYQASMAEGLIAMVQLSRQLCPVKLPTHRNAKDAQ